MADDTNPQTSKAFNITAIKQTTAAVPQEVRDLYARSPKSRQKNFKSKNNLKNTRIVDYYKKGVAGRTTSFNANRPSVENDVPRSVGEIDSIVCDDSYIKAQQASAEAKILATEMNQMLQKKEINANELILLNTRMILKTQESQDHLTNAMKKRDEQMLIQMTKKLNDCTDYVTNELNQVRQDIEEIKSNDEVEKMNTVMACKKDLTKIWIRFTYVEDINELRANKNPPAIVKEILSQLGIKMDKIQWPIESASFRSKTFSIEQTTPETALECVFVNSTIANRVKTEIRNFNIALETEEKTHMIRYRVATDWSYPVRRILKVCNEMKRFEVVNKVLITNDGIKVLHKEIERANGKNDKQTTSMHATRKANSSFVNSHAQLDSLRNQLQDYNYKIPAASVYGKDYFNNSFEQRKKMRHEFFEQMSSDEQEDMEVTITDSEVTYTSQHPKKD